MIIRIPSKTFVIGEYAVFEGAPAVLLNTKPYFEFHFSIRLSGAPFHKESPAACLIKRYSDFFSKISIVIKDPHENRGGFGRSSAEWLALYYFYSKEKKEPFSMEKLLKEARKDSGGLSSGVDVLSQFKGGLFIFEPHHLEGAFQTGLRSRPSPWSCGPLSFALIRTGESLNTWEHLKKIKPLKNQYSDLKKEAEKALLALKKADADLLTQSLDQYSHLLEKKNLTSQSSLEILKNLRQHPDIRSAKACGAMGAEVIAVFFNKADEKSVLPFLRQKYEVLAGVHDLADGLKAV